MPQHAGSPAPHEHGHGHGHLLDWDTRADDLEQEGEIGLPWFEAAAGWLAELSAAAGVGVRQILDVGSGPGVATSVLAARFGAARVTAVDSAAALLARARDRAERLGVGDRVDVRPGELGGDLSALPEADVIWASRVLHHVPDQAAAMRALGERLRPSAPGRPGGLLAVAEGGLPYRFLPDECGIGSPGLQERLDAAVAQRLAPLLGHGADSPTPRPVLDWPAQLAAAGLEPAGSRTFLLDLAAPVSPAVRAHLIHRIGRTPDLASELLEDDDQAAVAQLLDPDNPLGLHLRPDLFLLTATTVHTARRAS